jgi:hypothetical protein
MVRADGARRPQVKPRQQKRRQRVEGELNHSGKRRIVTGLLWRDFTASRATRDVDSVDRAMYFQRVDRAAPGNSLAGVGEEGSMVKYIGVASYWLGVVFSVVAVVTRIGNALGYEFAHVSTRGNNIDFRSFLDAGLLFLFIAIASANYEWFQSRQRGS